MENQDSDRLTPEQRHRLGVLVAKIETAHQQDEQANHDGLESLAEIWRDRLYRKFGSLEEFVNRQFQGKSRQWAYNKIAQVTVLENLKGIGVRTSSEKKAQYSRNSNPTCNGQSPQRRGLQVERGLATYRRKPCE